MTGRRVNGHGLSGSVQPAKKNATDNEDGNNAFRSSHRNSRTLHKSDTTDHLSPARTWLFVFHTVKSSSLLHRAQGIALYNLPFPILDSFRILPMLLRVFSDKATLGRAAAEQAANAIRCAISERGKARIIAATAASQLEFLDALTKAPGIDWTQVEAFHLDEYIGLPITHPGSFRKMLMEELVNKTGITHYHLLEGDAPDPSAAVRDAGKQLASGSIDIAFLGIGENGHIAFNDPPADFDTEEPYIIVHLDEACRHQQVGEAWFADISQVPKRAISMSARQILKAKKILAVVPDRRKAQAVKACFEGEISPMAPASILRRHPDATVYLDTNSASLLGPELQTMLKADSQATVT
jgi:glucosamine-6-phosphate deaminase